MFERRLTNTRVYDGLIGHNKLLNDLPPVLFNIFIRYSLIFHFTWTTSTTRKSYPSSTIIMLNIYNRNEPVKTNTHANLK